LDRLTDDEYQSLDFLEMLTTYLRFVLEETDQRTGNAKGLFTAAYSALRSGELYGYEEKEIKEAMEWLERHLPVPDKFSKNRNASHKNTHGISWFKPKATETLKQIRRIVAVLEEHGTKVKVLKTTRPGYVVYEDRFQIVAEPFHGEKI
jgi:hypothetical protein